MYAIMATMRAKEGQEAELEALLRGLIEPTRAEPGNVVYNFYRGARDPRLFVFYEEYRDRDAFRAHATSDRMKDAFERWSPLLEEPGQVVQLEPLDVAPPKAS